MVEQITDHGNVAEARLAIFFEAALYQRAYCVGTFDGSAVQSGSPRTTAAMTSVRSSPSKARLPGEHLVEHTAEGPDVAALVGRLPLRLLRAHVHGSAEMMPALVAMAGDVIVGDAERSA